MTRVPGRSANSAASIARRRRDLGQRPIRFTGSADRQSKQLDAISSIRSLLTPLLHAFCIVSMSLSHGFGIVCIEQGPQDPGALLHPENALA